GCKMYPDLSYSETVAATETLVLGVVPIKTEFEGSVIGEVVIENGCKCGDNCTCNPCNCLQNKHTNNYGGCRGFNNMMTIYNKVAAGCRPGLG
ncbi:hypothetical protein EI009_26035, partial [Escherichia coli]|nr:hypothetical protein [Escherichia coli]